MKVIYHCYGGAHSSVVAAALHLGILQPDRQPSPQELLALDLFDQADAYDHGIFHLLGKDDRGNEVYSVGLEGVAQSIIRSLRGLCALYAVPQHDVLFVDTLKCVNTRMRVGGLLSRAIRWVNLGRPLVLSGTQQAFTPIADTVAGVKKHLATDPGDAADNDRSNQPGKQDATTARPGEPGFPSGSGRAKTVYFCYGGTHTSVFCAAYHLGWLPSGRAPTIDEIVRLPCFDRIPNSQLGDLVFFGTDAQGTDVFAMGMGAPRQLVQRAIRDFLERHFGTVPGDLWFRDCLELAPLSVRIGGFLSRRLHLQRPGRYLAARGLQTRWQAYANFVRGVRSSGASVPSRQELV